MTTEEEKESNNNNSSSSRTTSPTTTTTTKKGVDGGGSSGGGDPTTVPGAVPVRGIDSIDQDNNNDDDHDNIIDDDGGDDDDNDDNDDKNNKDAAGDIETGTGTGTGKTVATTTTTDKYEQPVVEAELVVEEAPKPLEPVYDAEEVTPQQQCNRKVWGGVGITLIIVVITLVLVGIFVITPNNDNNGDGTAAEIAYGGSSNTTSSPPPPPPTNAPTFDPNTPHWSPQGEFITWTGNPADSGFGVTVELSNDGNVLAVVAPLGVGDGGLIAAVCVVDIGVKSYYMGLLPIIFVPRALYGMCSSIPHLLSQSQLLLFMYLLLFFLLQHCFFKKNNFRARYMCMNGTTLNLNGNSVACHCTALPLVVQSECLQGPCV